MRRIVPPAERRVTAVADPMSPAAAVLMRPAGVSPAQASLPAAVLADPAVVLDLRAVAQAVPADSVVPVDSAVGRRVEAGAGDQRSPHRIVAAAPEMHRVSFFRF